MNANRENLEALLCAFIDDELSAEQRQIIEQHLAANPRDLKLMAELARTRQLLRDLPRQTAPPDLAEALQVQLERRSLLDGDEFVGRPVRMTIMPRVWSIAALVVVAVGMGIVIHSVLPPTGRFAPQTLVRATVAVSDRELAKDGPTPMTEIGTALTLRDHAEGKKEDGAFNASALTATALPTSGRSGRPEITETRAMATGKDAGGDYTRVAEKSTGYFLWSAGTAGAQHKPQSTDNNSVAPTPVVVIVNTNNTPATNDQVAKYLQVNKLAWTPANTDLARNEEEVRARDRLDMEKNRADKNGRLDDGGLGDATLNNGAAPNQADSRVAQHPGDITVSPKPSVNDAKCAGEDHRDTRTIAAGAENTVSEGVSTVDKQQAQTQPAGQFATGNFNLDNGMNMQVNPLRGNALAQAANYGNPDNNSNSYVVRGMNRRQIDDLRQTLGQQAMQQTQIVNDATPLRAEQAAVANAVRHSNPASHMVRMSEQQAPRAAAPVAQTGLEHGGPEAGLPSGAQSMGGGGAYKTITPPKEPASTTLPMPAAGIQPPTTTAADEDQSIDVVIIVQNAPALAPAAGPATMQSPLPAATVPTSEPAK